VLDWGAGSGFLGAGVLAAAPGAQVTLVELDALAAAAAKENVTGARVVQGDGWEALGHLAPFDVLVANPPYHRGKEESMSEVVRLLAGIPGGMAPGGIARLVVQRRLPLEGVLSRAFRSVSVVADEGPFRVWEGRR
jgi:16S rRNA (guanine1207-N2)-methyltransferase